MGLRVLVVTRDVVVREAGAVGHTVMERSRETWHARRSLVHVCAATRAVCVDKHCPSARRGGSSECVRGGCLSPRTNGDDEDDEEYAMNFLDLSWSGWLLWLAILAGITTRCLNMWSYGAAGWLARFRHDGRLFRTVMPVSGLLIGTLAWSWGTYGSAAANLVLALATLRPDLVRRQRWLAHALGSPVGMVAVFAVAPILIIALTPGSLAERVQLAGGYQLIIGFLAMLAGAWDGERSADTWRWLIICLSVDAMLGAGAIALAAVPIVALEVLALAMDLTKLTRKVTESQAQRLAPVAVTPAPA